MPIKFSNIFRVWEIILVVLTLVAIAVTFYRLLPCQESFDEDDLSVANNQLRLAWNSLCNVNYPRGNLGTTTCHYNGNGPSPSLVVSTEMRTPPSNITESSPLTKSELKTMATHLNNIMRPFIYLAWKSPHDTKRMTEDLF